MAALVLVLAACGRNDYLGAAVTGGLGVAGAGVHRATTKGCWGQCMNGLVCDHESGMCVEQASCGGKCSRSERCEEGTVSRCVPIVELGHDHDSGVDGSTKSWDDGGRDMER